VVVSQFEIAGTGGRSWDVADTVMAKRPRDPIKLAKQVFDIATGDAEDTVSESKRHPDPRRAGGLKGGRARAKSLTPEARSRIALQAANKRWGKPSK
jgi:hypothetical protein